MQPAITGALRAHWIGILNASGSRVVDAPHARVGIFGDKHSTKLAAQGLRMCSFQPLRTSMISYGEFLRVQILPVGTKIRLISFRL